MKVIERLPRNGLKSGDSNDAHGDSNDAHGAIAVRNRIGRLVEPALSGRFTIIVEGEETRKTRENTCSMPAVSPDLP